MDWIAWDDSLDTGHTRMDAEHKQLAQLFNRLRDAVDGGEGKAACAEVLDGIIGHAQAHFELEQQMMARHAYPKATQHAAEHAMLLRQARDYRDSFDVNTAAARAAAMEFPRSGSPVTSCSRTRSWPRFSRMPAAIRANRRAPHECRDRRRLL